MGFKMISRPIGCCISIMGLLAVQPLQAADLPGRSAPVLPVFAAEPDWSGFYLGRHVGGFVSGRGKSTFASGDGGPVAVNGFGGVGGRTGNAVGRISGPGIFSGFHGGYNFQQGHAVFGLEGALDGLGRSSDVLGSLRGRLGYASGSILVYGTAGVAIRSFGGGRLGTFIGGNGGNGGNGGPGGDGGTGGNGFGTLSVARNSATSAGFAGGLGAEVKLTPQVSAGIEALYYRFGKNPGFGASRDAVAINGRLTFHPGGPAAQAAGEYASWGGFYAGGHVGAAYNLSKSAIDSVALANGQNGGAGTRGIDGGGGGGGAVAFASFQRNAAILGGLHAGYNWQSGQIVYGVEGDADLSADKSHAKMASLRARLGYAYQSFLIYGTGGIAFDRNEAVRAVFAGNGGNGGNGGAILLPPGGAGGAGGLALSLRANDTRTGFVIGAGSEAKISKNVTAGFETLYYGFGNGSTAVAFPGGGRALANGSKNSALVLRTRLSVSLQP